jgi:hypothetical protein
MKSDVHCSAGPKLGGYSTELGAIDLRTIRRVARHRLIGTGAQRLHRTRRKNDRQIKCPLLQAHSSQPGDFGFLAAQPLSSICLRRLCIPETSICNIGGKVRQLDGHALSVKV